MTKILLFITPTSLIKLGTQAAEFIPIIGPTVEYTKKAQKVLDITNPVTASSRGIGLVFNFCFGKAGALSAECILWLGLSVAGGVTCNPALIAVGAQLGALIIDEIVD